MKRLIRVLEENPIIAAIKSKEQLERALGGDNEVIFLLGGNIFNTRQMIEAVHENNKLCFIHFALIKLNAEDLKWHKLFKMEKLMLR